MTNPTQPFERMTALLAALAIIGLLAGCAEPTPEAETAETSETESAEPDVYTVRGEVVTVPSSDDEERTLSIRHEAIDDYKGVGGEIWGMDSMTMPFPVADEVSFDDVEVGDKIRFTLAVDWFGEEPVAITGIEEIDPATELEFRKARPEGGDAEGDGDHDDHDEHG